MHRRRQTGKTGADDADIDLHLSLERRVVGLCGVSFSQRHSSRNGIARLQQKPNQHDKFKCGSEPARDGVSASPTTM